MKDGLLGHMDDPYARQYLADILKREDFPNSGLYVKTVSGASINSGISANDFILEVDGQKIETTFDLNKVLLPKKVGDTVKVKYWHAGQTKETNVTLAESQTKI
jgi:serine protease Do